MNVLKRYSIPFKGLSAGKHEFFFEVDDAFFKAFDGSEIEKGAAKVEVHVTKSGNMLQVEVVIKGEVTVACDRCLEDLTMPVDYTGGFVVRFAEETPDFDGEIMWLSPGESDLNLAQYIYESVSLSLPYQRVHPEGKCNAAMLERFKIVTEDEFEELTALHDEKMEDNPQWEKLKELKDKIKE